MKLYFVRHGESTANEEGRFTGGLEAELTELGRKQATALGKKLAEQDLRPDIIIASPKVRATNTAQLIAIEIGYPESNIVQEPLITERYMGSLQGKLRQEVGPLTDEILRESGAESEDDVLDRARGFIDQLKGADFQTVLVVSHNGFGKRLKAVTNNLPVDAAFNLPDFVNADIVELAEI